MAEQLNLDVLPQYAFSSLKIFADGEKHVERFCRDDVLIIMLEGTLYFVEGEKQIEVSKGNYYIQKRYLYQNGVKASNGAKYYYVHFKGSYDKGNKTLALSGKADVQALLPLCEELEYLQMTQGSKTEKTAVFYKILSLLAREKERNTAVSVVIARLAEDISKKYSLDELAKECGYSKNMFISLFKKEMGMAPYTYIQKMRLAAAKRLLAYSNVNVSEISEKCGFGDYVNFYKTFVKEEGCSPIEWRKKKNI